MIKDQNNGRDCGKDEYQLKLNAEQIGQAQSAVEARIENIEIELGQTLPGTNVTQLHYDLNVFQELLQRLEQSLEQEPVETP